MLSRLSNRREGSLKLRRAVTLVEIMIAIVILAVAVLPVIVAFSRYYGVASRQFDNELALKLSEAAMNKLLNFRYLPLVNNESFSVPLDFQTPAGAVVGNLNFSGGTGTSGPIQIGNVTYNLTAEVTRVFVAQDIDTPHTNALEFEFAIDPADSPVPVPPPPPAAVVGRYSCQDDLIMIKLSVDYGGPKDHFELAAFRADMNQ